MYQKTLTLILAFAALSFLGYGISGFYALDPSSHSLCVEDKDCSYSVCCPVYDTEYGVCAQESECASIYGDSSGNAVSSEAPDVADLAERSYIAVVLGILFLLILAIVGYLEWKQEKMHGKKKRVKK